MKERLRHAPSQGDKQAGEVRETGHLWSLKRVRQEFDWLRDYSLSGVWHLLRREGVRLRQGRPQQYSPDPAYEQKEARLVSRLSLVGQQPDKEVLLFSDEFTYYHWPLPGATWSNLDDPAPVARRADPGEYSRRIVAGVNAWQGQLTALQADSITGDVFAQFLQLVHQRYPDAARITVVADNWPVHSAKIVQKTLGNLPRLDLLFLPTYSPWLNPIEKLWAWLKDDLLRLHPFAGQWATLKQAVSAFLDRFAKGSTQLLHRIGLSGDGKLAQALSTDLDRKN